MVTARCSSSTHYLHSPNCFKPLKQTKKSASEASLGAIISVVSRPPNMEHSKKQLAARTSYWLQISTAISRSSILVPPGKKKALVALETPRASQSKELSCGATTAEKLSQEMKTESWLSGTVRRAIRSMCSKLTHNRLHRWDLMKKLSNSLLAVRIKPSRYGSCRWGGLTSRPRGEVKICRVFISPLTKTTRTSLKEVTSKILEQASMKVCGLRTF